ncbi:unnamed protein product [Hymenolepis diminuta]|uniref:Bladder cancer-associated protein n=1 Tax=Hymenolepis diminuta TaxID=6216 RepID=A0A0R3S7N4_HYMDI|nr:unnamed protein product [Hymenolepis diminuta]VUZ55009.1 unnamed protein product [Hymenolepis diminuta]
MYCLQLILPLLFTPKPSNPASHVHHTVYVILTLLIFLLERKPCSVCTTIFLAFVFLPCISSVPDQCMFPICFSPQD